jgi:hypothetical protein
MNSFSDFALSLSALAALVPLGLVRPDKRGTLWLALAVAIAGPAAWLAHGFADGWRTGFATALWLAILVSVASYAGLVAWVRGSERLAPLLAAYLVALASVATTWQHAPERPLAGQPPEAWLIAHVLMALVAYGLLTLAAVAGLAVFLQERALKTKRPTGFTRRLPSIAEGEALLANLLMASGTVEARPQDGAVLCDLSGDRRVALRSSIGGHFRPPGGALCPFCVFAAHLGLSGREVRHGRDRRLKIVFCGAKRRSRRI